MRGRALVLALGLVLVTDCAHRVEAEDPREPLGDAEITGAPSARAALSGRGEPMLAGVATWYGARLAGHRTASGERFDPHQLTAAHRSFAFGTWVEVTRVDTGARVRVRITDRGPFGRPDRVIDLSRAAAEKLGMLRRGIAWVELRVVSGP